MAVIPPGQHLSDATTIADGCIFVAKALWDLNNISPLQWAKKLGDKEVIEMLEKAGAKE